MSRDIYPYVWLGDDGILHVDYGRNPRIDLDAIRSALAQHLAISPIPRPILIRGEGIVTSTAEAEDFANGPEISAVTTALALLQPNAMIKLIVKLYLTYRRPPYPCQAFDDEQSAIAWLKQYLPKP